MQDAYERRLQRILNAVSLRPVDKIPFVPCAPAFFPLNAGLSLKTAITDFDAACTANIQQSLDFDADGTQATIFSPYLLSANWLSKISVPGVELGDNDLWQMNEQTDFVTQEDYHFILEHGFGAFFEMFKRERLGDIDRKLAPFFQYAPAAGKRFYEAGLPCVCDLLMITPFEYFCGGRSLESFFMDDLCDAPELVEQVFEKTMEYTMAAYQAQFDLMHPTGVWIGGWRSVPSILSPEMWDRFVWPYIWEYAQLCLKNNVVPIFHLDSNWDMALERFKEFPSGKCILALDGKTDIQLAGTILGGHMCIMGDVPPELLAFGSYQEVYDYSTHLMKTVGPCGFILASGCDIPPNAKPENIRAMGDAARCFRT